MDVLARDGQNDSELAALLRGNGVAILDPALEQRLLLYQLNYALEHLRWQAEFDDRAASSAYGIGSGSCSTELSATAEQLLSQSEPTQTASSKPQANNRSLSCRREEARTFAALTHCADKCGCASEYPSLTMTHR